MLSFYYLPPEAFDPYIAPFSILLDTDRQFAVDGKAYNYLEQEIYITNENIWKLCPDTILLYNVIGAYFGSRENGCYHFSNINCRSAKFEDNTILSINKHTGKWMLRKPYSEKYP